MNAKKQKTVTQNLPGVNEDTLFAHVAKIIETRKSRAASYANCEVTLMYWEIGRHINSVVLGDKRAEYGKQIFSTLSRKLVSQYGKPFAEENLYRMVQFAEKFSDVEKVAPLSQQLSWSHFCELIRLKTNDAMFFYATEAAERRLGVRDLRHQIARKTYERREIANAQLTKQSAVPFNVFKDPYLLDTLGLRDNFLEADLEKAILSELETFILEFGHGFTFVERQKRMIIDGDDIVLDLLFYHRILKRLVAVELKLGTFKAAYMGQMLLYLKWLNRHERQEGEETPIGLILCATASREKIELLELDKSGIAVAEFWTALPPKKELERKINQIMREAKERLERRKSLPIGKTTKKLDYFYETNETEEE